MNFNKHTKFVASKSAGDCTLLCELHQYVSAHSRDPDFYIDGLILLDIEPYQGTILYDCKMTPTNSLSFATTGGDDVHFGMLRTNGVYGDHSPVVMTVPTADLDPRKANFVVGESLHDFLCLGCTHGFFQLEDMAYSKLDQFVHLFSKPSRFERSFAELRSALSLTPWTEVPAKLKALDLRFKSLLEFTDS